ncbi:hypothetical protein SAMN02910292_02909 [Lachnospiraceae bacterium XBB2008]|nr:hypothetical protein SAMN02910292_02909 [Lachnospiraceae bacterium XBB2008]
MNKKQKKTAALMLTFMLAASAIGGCGRTEEMSVEDQVAEALADSAYTDGDSSSGVHTEPIPAEPDENRPDKKEGTIVQAPASPVTDYAAKDEDTGAVSINPFLGSSSTATSFDIRFNIETDSGVAGITWGSMDGKDGEYYLFAFDCTRDIPMLYTSRRQGDAVYDEQYTNLDFMYPEMVMFTSVEHIVEIRVSQTTATTYLDKYKVCETTLNEAKPVGQFGTWVQKGNYHEYIDNLFVAEDVDGGGEWIYSEDFARRDNLFSPELKTVSGRLYATAGYHVAPLKEDSEEQTE